MPPSFQLVGPLQIQVMEAMWTADVPLTITEIVQAINHPRVSEGAAELAYTTLLTVSRNLFRRKLANRVRVGKADMYSAALSRKEYRRQVARWCVETYFAGDASAFTSACA